MTRYYVASAGSCESVRQAINAGWRAGPAQYAERWVNGTLVKREPIDAWELRTGRPVGWLQLLTAERVIVGGDGSTALELPDSDLTGQHIADQLGKTVGGTAIPSSAALVQVARPRDSSQLPAGVRDKVDDAYVDSALAQADTPQARAAITAELQGRAAAALARKDARGAQAALEKAMGIGRSS